MKVMELKCENKMFASTATFALTVLVLIATASCRPQEVKRTAVNDFLGPVVYTSPNRKEIARREEDPKMLGKERKIDIGVKYVNDFDEDDVKKEEKLPKPSFSEKEKSKKDYVKKNVKKYEVAEGQEDAGAGKTFIPARHLSDRLPMEPKPESAENKDNEPPQRAFVPMRDISDRLPELGGIILPLDSDTDEESEQRDPDSDNQSLEDQAKAEKNFVPMRDIYDRLPLEGGIILPLNPETSEKKETDAESAPEEQNDQRSYIPMREISDRLPEGGGIVLPLDPISEDKSVEDIEAEHKAETNIAEKASIPVIRDTVVPAKPLSTDKIDQDSVIVPLSPKDTDQDPEGDSVDDSSEEPDMILPPALYPGLVLPQGISYSVPILVPIRRLMYGPISVIPVPDMDVSDRMPQVMGGEVMADTSEAGPQVSAKQVDAAEEQRKAAYEAGSQFGVAMRYPFWSLQEMLRQVEDIVAGLNTTSPDDTQKDKPKGDATAEVKDIDGKRFYMQTNTMRLPSSEDSRMFVRMISVIPVRGTAVPVNPDSSEKGLEEAKLKEENGKSVEIKSVKELKKFEKAKNAEESEFQLQDRKRKFLKNDPDKSHEHHLKPKYGAVEHRLPLEKENVKHEKQSQKDGKGKDNLKDLEVAEAKDFVLLDGKQ